MSTDTQIFTCLDGLVGIDHCAPADLPSSGLFINELPGITIELLQMISQKEDETYMATWDKIYKNAIIRFRTAVMAQVNQCYQINEQATVECLVCENVQLFSTAFWYLLGNMATVHALSTWRVNVFPTLRKPEIEQLSAIFFTEFQKELKYAVQGIDVRKSDCMASEKDCPQPNGSISIRYSMP